MKADARATCDALATREVAGIGCLALRDFDLATDVATAHAWLTHPHARFWGMTEQSAADTQAYFAHIAAVDTHGAWIGTHDEVPMFLVERYDPAADVIGGFYEVAPGDIGMHILIAPPERVIHGFTSAVFDFVVASIFELDAARRLIVEPDVDNAGIHRLNAEAGFTPQADIDTGEKIARLCVLTRERYLACRQTARPSRDGY